MSDDKRAEDEAKWEKCVDLFARDLDHLDQITKTYPIGSTALPPGATALIDKGVTDIETGLYHLQENQQWVKIGVPAEGDRYRIMRLESAGKRYRIRKSFALDIRPPTEHQVFDNQHLSQDLAGDTSTIFVHPNVGLAPVLNVNPVHEAAANSHMDASFVLHGRSLTIQNCSPKFTMSVVFTDSKIVLVQPQTIRTLHLLVDTSAPAARFVLGATGASPSHAA
jgi:hypothetical protein